MAGGKETAVAKVRTIRRLREKVEPDPARPRQIRTFPGRGYRFTPD